MPNKTIYVRSGDLEKWEAIGNKSEWIHSILNDSWRGQPIKEMPEVMKPPPKCLYCGDYHFEYDPAYKDCHKKIEPSMDGLRDLIE